MKGHRKLQSFGFLAVSAVLLCSSSVAAQQVRPDNAPPLHGLASPACNAPLSAWATGTQPCTPSSSLATDSHKHSGTGSRPSESRDNSRATPSTSFYVGEVKNQPDRPGVLATGKKEEGPVGLTPPSADQEAPLAFYSARERYWRAQIVSAFPEKASPGMFPGSRLRGPFDQTYPRPFPGGGQP
jgi:hypothetical protein